MDTSNPDNLLSCGIRILRESDKDIDDLFEGRNDEIISLLARYINEIELFNSAYGLVGTNDLCEIIIKHILDSLSPLGIISRLLKGRAVRIADAGSGAGLPGIPLSIALPNCEFTLIERMGRRVGFLMNTKAALALSNITVEEGELEKTKNNYFSLITSRAFKPLEPKLLKAHFNACTEDGIIAAYKGRLEKTEKEIAPLKNTIKFREAIPYSVPFLNEERHLLIIRKN